ncbi:hypothetical protein C7C46_08545 [Streptomyces tateyamensis]|uniref:Lipoprotein n=1 Tax=Streptomyces tateyamensis TaxID=565073 RepID=A0A2V4NUF4_9ACTN|nr:hypothetical protein [Streptomyces tateyamensis]PYC83786.1 hypothetical protein C7C46_08545 [Streptomyces tateyamensis]
MLTRITTRTGAAVLAAVAVAALATGCGSGTKSDKAADKPTAAAPQLSPVGKWNVQVQTSLPSNGSAVLTFKQDGSLEQAGSDTLPGTGWWQPGKQPNQYTLEVVIPLTDHTTKAPTGTIRGIETVTLDGEKLTASGTAAMFDLQGKQLKTFDLSSHADSKLSS